MISRMHIWALAICLLAFPLLITSITMLAVKRTGVLGQSLKYTEPLVFEYLNSSDKQRIERLALTVQNVYSAPRLEGLLRYVGDEDESWAKIVYIIGNLDVSRYLNHVREGLRDGRNSMGYLNHDAVLNLGKREIEILKRAVIGAEFNEKQRWLHSLDYILESREEISQPGNEAVTPKQR